MIESKFTLDILDLILDDEAEAKSLREQIDFLTETEIEYTGIVMFIYFENVFIYEEPSNHRNSVYNGVELINEKQNVLADVILHVENGLIKSIEIFNKNGEDYPSGKLESYILRQIWISSKNRIISN